MHKFVTAEEIQQVLTDFSLKSGPVFTHDDVDRIAFEWQSHTEILDLCKSYRRLMVRHQRLETHRLEWETKCNDLEAKLAEADVDGPFDRLAAAKEAADLKTRIRELECELRLMVQSFRSSQQCVKDLLAGTAEVDPRAVEQARESIDSQGELLSLRWNEPVETLQSVKKFEFRMRAAVEVLKISETIGLNDPLVESAKSFLQGCFASAIGFHPEFLRQTMTAPVAKGQDIEAGQAVAMTEDGIAAFPNG